MCADISSPPLKDQRGEEAEMEGRHEYVHSEATILVSNGSERESVVEIYLWLK
jgi:hypothetical protein